MLTPDVRNCDISLRGVRLPEMSAIPLVVRDVPSLALAPAVPPNSSGGGSAGATRQDGVGGETRTGCEPDGHPPWHWVPASGPGRRGWLCRDHGVGWAGTTELAGRGRRGRLRRSDGVTSSFRQSLPRTCSGDAGIQSHGRQHRCWHRGVRCRHRGGSRETRTGGEPVADLPWHWVPASGPGRRIGTTGRLAAGTMGAPRHSGRMPESRATEGNIDAGTKV